MRKITLSLLCLFALSLSNLYSQITSIQSFDGTTYTVGDTILGGKNPIGSYLNISELIDGKSFLGIRTNLAYNKLVIQDWIKAKDFDRFASDDTLTVVKNLHDGKTLYVNLVNALKRKEIIAVPAVRLYSDAKEASLANFQSCCIRTNQLPITDFRIKYYIKAVDEDLGKKCQHDEFEYQAVKEQYQAKLESDIKNFDFDKIYYIDQTMGIGKYDFNKKGFPINFMRINGKGFVNYEDFYLSIPNLDSYSSFMIAPDKAKRVNKLQYGNQSYASNIVNVRCYFKFLDQKMEIKKDKYEFGNPETQYRDGIVGIQLVGMEFYTEPHMEYNYLGCMRAE